MAILANFLVRIGIDGDRVEQGLGRIGGAFERHGAKIAAAGAAIGAGGGVALVQGIQAGIEKEALGDRLAAQLGATGPEAARLGKVAGDLYSQGLGSGLEEVHDAVGAVVSSIDGMRGASSSAIEDLSAKALNLAKGFEVDVADSARAAGAMIQVGLAKDGAQAMDMLTASMQKIPASIREELIDHMDEYSRHMARFGITGDRAVSFIAAAAEKGKFSFDKWLDAIGEIEKRILGADTATKDAFKDLGLNFDEIRAKVGKGGKAGQEAIQQMASALSKVKDPAEQSALAFDIFGTQAEDLAKMGLPQFLAELQKTDDQFDSSAGAADRFGQTLNDNAATGIESWKRKTDEALASLVDAPGLMGDTAQAATGITQSLAPVGQSLGGLALTAFVAGQSLGGIGGKAKAGLSKVGGFAKTAGARVKGFATSAGSATANLGKRMGTAAASVGKGAGRIAASAGRAAASMTRMAATAALAAGRMAASAAMAAGRVVASWVLMAVQSMIRAAIMAVSWLIAFWPVLLIVALVAIVVALIIKYWDQIVAFFTKTLPAWIRQGASMIIGIIKWLAKVGFFGPVGLIIAHWDKVKHFFMVTVPNALKRFASLAVSVIKRAAQLGFLGPIGLIIAHWTRIKNFFTKTLPNAVRNGINRVAAFVRSLPGRIRSAVGNLGGLLVQAGRNVVNGLIRGITSRFGALASKASEMASKIRNVLPFSPAKEGPLSGRGSPERAGRKIGDMVAAGMVRGTGTVASAAAGMAGAAAVHPGAVAAAGLHAATPAGVRSAGGDGATITIRGNDSDTTRFLMELLRRGVAESGGNVQTVLGRS